MAEVLIALPIFGVSYFTYNLSTDKKAFCPICSSDKRVYKKLSWKTKAKRDKVCFCSKCKTKYVYHGNGAPLGQV